MHEHLGTPAVSPEAVAALKNYTGDGYHQMDVYLRTGNSRAPHQMGVGGTTKAKLDQRIAALDSMFAQATPTSRPLVVYRGMTPPDSRPGEEWEDSTPVSTSSSLMVGDRFRRSRYSDAARLVRVVIPPGAKAVSVPNVTGSDPAQEHEVLLPRGSKFRVTGPSKDDLGGRILNTELVV